jgi:hypothetical protein
MEADKDRQIKHNEERPTGYFTRGDRLWKFPER